jgi:hypothetical protein
MLRLITSVLSFLVLGFGFSLEGSEAWYQTLVPGVTRDDVHKMAGLPNASVGDQDRYKMTQGYIIVQYQDETVVDCKYFQPPGGAIDESLYFTFGGVLTEQQSMRRRAYLTGHDFTIVPVFEGSAIRTSGESGICYPIDGRYVIVEPIVSLMGGIGFFTEKAAKVTVFERTTGKRTILYRAIDHWESLRPPQLVKVDSDTRLIKLRALGQDLSFKSIARALGPADSEMGSGIDYDLYYLPVGLLITTDGAEAILDRPGESWVTLHAWLSK